MATITPNTQYQPGSVPGFESFTMIPTSKSTATGDDFSGLAMGGYSPHEAAPTLEYDENGRAYGVRDPQTGRIYNVSNLPPNVTSQDLANFIASVRMPPKVQSAPAVSNAPRKQAMEKPRTTSNIVLKLNGIKVSLAVLEGIVSDDRTSLMLIFPSENEQPIELDRQLEGLVFALPTCSLVCSYYGQKFNLKSGDTAVIFLIDSIQDS